MAQLFQSPYAGNTPVIQTRTRGRLPKQVTSLWRIRGDRRYAAHCERLRQEEITKTRAAMAMLDIGKAALGYALARLEVSK